MEVLTAYIRENSFVFYETSEVDTSEDQNESSLGVIVKPNIEAILRVTKRRNPTF